MTSNTPELLNEWNSKETFVAKKLKELADSWSDKKVFVQTLKWAIQYLNNPNSTDFEEYLLNNDIYSKLVELPWIKEGLADVISNSTFNQLEQEYHRFLRKNKTHDKTKEIRMYFKNMMTSAQNEKEGKVVIDIIKTNIRETQEKLNEYNESWTKKLWKPGDSISHLDAFLMEYKGYARTLGIDIEE